jgi:hypothetical protein
LIEPGARDAAAAEPAAAARTAPTPAGGVGPRSPVAKTPAEVGPIAHAATLASNQAPPTPTLAGQSRALTPRLEPPLARARRLRIGVALGVLAAVALGGIMWRLQASPASTEAVAPPPEAQAVAPASPALPAALGERAPSSPVVTASSVAPAEQPIVTVAAPALPISTSKVAAVPAGAKPRSAPPKPPEPAPKTTAKPRGDAILGSRD